MTKKVVKRDTCISVDLEKEFWKKGLFALARVTGIRASSEVRSLVFNRLREAAAQGLITLEEDGKD